MRNLPQAIATPPPFFFYVKSPWRKTRTLNNEIKIANRLSAIIILEIDVSSISTPKYIKDRNINRKFSKKNFTKNWKIKVKI